jgi:hypothetical protein
MSRYVTQPASNPGFESSLSARARKSEATYIQIGNRIVSRDENLTNGTTPDSVTGDSMNCTPLSAADAQKCKFFFSALAVHDLCAVKGFPQFQDWVKKNFGGLGADIVTNSPQVYFSWPRLQRQDIHNS